MSAWQGQGLEYKKIPVQKKKKISNKCQALLQGLLSQCMRKSKKLPAPYQVYILMEKTKGKSIQTQYFAVLVNAISQRPLLGGPAGQHMSGKTTRPGL